jgi:Domain of unknown function (DUF305)
LSKSNGREDRTRQTTELPPLLHRPGASHALTAFSSASTHRTQGVAVSNSLGISRLGMIPHHQGAVDMAEIVLKFGKDARNQHFAREIINTQRREIGEMREWLKQKNIPQP